MLSHELRNPLAPMSNTLDVLRLRGTTSPELDVLERQVRHVTRLVDDLLDVSRIAHGKVALERTDLDLGTVVARALEMTNPLIRQRLHRVVTDLLPAAVNGDANRLAQVAANLITNAAKYSAMGSHIRIRTQRAGDVARLVVADEGIGMAPDMIERVFDAFVQQPQMLARSSGGLGLGLSIVRASSRPRAVSAHSGGLGKGSTFVVELPAVDATTARADVAHRGDSLRASTQPLRILVVDDNYDAAAALQGALEVLGHVVAVAHDGPSALANAGLSTRRSACRTSGSPAWMGTRLPSRCAARPIRLVAITGYGQERDRRRVKEGGFRSHLVKPVDLDDLMRS
jgi:CheY-like chemotaxis protein